MQPVFSPYFLPAYIIELHGLYTASISTYGTDVTEWLYPIISSADALNPEAFCPVDPSSDKLVDGGQ